jgi:hypothetical protein
MGIWNQLNESNLFKITCKIIIKIFGCIVKDLYLTFFGIYILILTYLPILQIYIYIGGHYFFLL